MLKLYVSAKSSQTHLTRTLTVFNEDVDRLFGQTVLDDVLVCLHHVGAEDLLVAAFGHVGSGRSRVAFK